MTTDDVGVVIPAEPGGRRSSSALGRAVVADALRSVDPVGAVGVERETNWRSGYPVHFRRALEAGVASRHAAETVAADGLRAVHQRMQFRRPDGRVESLEAMDFDPSGATPATVEVRGTGRARNRIQPAVSW